MICTAAPEQLSGDARVNFDLLPGDRALLFEDARAGDAIRRSAAVVDALLGTGFEGAPRGPVADAIEAVNDAGAPVVSVDVPSGVDASTGEVAGTAVRAKCTLTFQCCRGSGFIPASVMRGRRL